LGAAKLHWIRAPYEEQTNSELEDWTYLGNLFALRERRRAPDPSRCQGLVEGALRLRPGLIKSGALRLLQH